MLFRSLALVGYYFGQKQELYDAIFGHLASTVDARRLLLHAAMANQNGDALANIIDAMITPVTQARGTPEGGAYALFVTRSLTQQSIEEDRSIREYFDPITAEYIDAIRDALLPELPTITQAQAAWCFQFALGSLLHYLSDQRIVRLSKDVNVAADPALRRTCRRSSSTAFALRRDHLSRQQRHRQRLTRHQALPPTMQRAAAICRTPTSEVSFSRARILWSNCEC